MLTPSFPFFWRACHVFVSLAHSPPHRSNSPRRARHWRRSSPRSACPGGPWCASPREARPSPWRPTRCARLTTSVPAGAGPSRQSEHTAAVYVCVYSVRSHVVNCSNICATAAATAVSTCREKGLFALGGRSLQKYPQLHPRALCCSYCCARRRACTAVQTSAVPRRARRPWFRRHAVCVVDPSVVGGVRSILLI